jgi:hypothetical protein
VDAHPFEVPPGREVTSVGGRTFTIRVERGEVHPAVHRAGGIGRLGWRVQALLHRAEHTMRTRGDAWRVLAFEGSADGAPARTPFLDETHHGHATAIARAEHLAETLARAGA